MKKAISVFLALLLSAGIFFCPECFAEQAAMPSAESSISPSWMAGALKILGIAGKEGSPLSEEMLAELAGQLKTLLDAGQSLTEEALRPMIESLLSRYGITIGETQLSTLLDLFRNNGTGQGEEQSVASRIQDVQDTIGKISDTASGAMRFFRSFRRTAQEILNWFSHLKDLFH